MTRTENSSHSEELLSLLQEKLTNQIAAHAIKLGDVAITVSREHLFETLKILKLDSDLAFNLFVSVTAVDYMDERDDRYEVVYHLSSLSKKHRVRIHVPVPEEDPKVASATQLWSGANFMEREVWDMYGITFEGHPDLRRILLYEEFKGHPLRKDYPVQGKQPRIPLRAPEVENTARKMQRPDLGKINTRSKGDGSRV